MSGFCSKFLGGPATWHLSTHTMRLSSNVWLMLADAQGLFSDLLGMLGLFAE